MAGFVEVATTLGSRAAADHLADTLVSRRLAACVQVEGPLSSTYRWRGNVERAEEWRCTARTTAELTDDLLAAIRQAHPYELPELLVRPIGGSPEYLAWIHDGVGDGGRTG